MSKMLKTYLCSSWIPVTCLIGGTLLTAFITMPFAKYDSERAIVCFIVYVLFLFGMIVAGIYQLKNKLYKQAGITFLILFSIFCILGYLRKGQDGRLVPYQDLKR